MLRVLYPAALSILTIPLHSRTSWVGSIHLITPLLWVITTAQNTHSLSSKAFPSLSCFHTIEYVIPSWKPTHSSRPILSLSPFMKPSWTITVSRGIKCPYQVSALQISSSLTAGLEGPWGQRLYVLINLHPSQSTLCSLYLVSEHWIRKHDPLVLMNLKCEKQDIKPVNLIVCVFKWTHAQIPLTTLLEHREANQWERMNKGEPSPF